MKTTGTLIVIIPPPFPPCPKIQGRRALDREGGGGLRVINGGGGHTSTFHEYGSLYGEACTEKK
jgi:hypothetical protein